MIVKGVGTVYSKKRRETFDFMETPRRYDGIMETESNQFGLLGSASLIKDLSLSKYEIFTDKETI